MVDFLEDPQGLEPGPAGLDEIARALVHVPEVDEGFGLVVSIRELAAQLDGSLVVGNGLLVVAEPVVNITEAVQRGLHPVVFPEFLARGEGTLAATQRLLVVAEQGVCIADVVEHQKLDSLVACCPVQLKGSQGMGEAVGVALPLLSQPGEAAVRARADVEVAPDLVEQPFGAVNAH